MNEQIINLAVNLLQSKLGIDADKIKAGISELFSDGFDVQKLLSAVSGSDLGSIVSSWIGNGSNMPVDVEGIKKIFGEEKLQKFANVTGVDSSKAAEALKDVVPEIVDKATPNGEDILSSLGGISGVGDMLKKLF